MTGWRRNAAACWRAIACGARDLGADTRGQIALIFGLAIVVVLTAIGGGIDLGRAYLARQQLSNVAQLACQYANRPSVLQQVFGAGPRDWVYGADTYRSAVNAYITTSLGTQHLPWSQTVATPFTYATGGAGNVSLGARVPTAFMGIVGVPSIPVAATLPCPVTGTVQPPVPDASNPLLIKESFENAACTAGTTCVIYYNPNGTTGQGNPNVQNTPGTQDSYVGATGTEWLGTGYCLEVDSVGTIKSTVPDGTHSAELDCDNTGHSAGNSSISTKVYLQTGGYELRWFYVARIDYPMYDPVHICGSAASDTVWANASVPTYLTRTNQINVYLDADATGAPPTHTTLDGTQQLAGANLVDTCLYAQNWIERSIPITVTKAGYFWLSFAADGHNDSFGGQVDNIRLCQVSCGLGVPDNFPPAWLAASNGGGNKQLFRDTFESPVVKPSCSGCAYGAAGLDASNGSTGTSASGWPSQPASGWIMTPYDSAKVELSQAGQGAQSVGLDAASSTQASTSNRSINRQFLLDPGYYQLDYDYISDAVFPAAGANVYCTAAPTNLAAYVVSGSASATDRTGGSAYTANQDTDFTAAFMSNAQLVSTPSSSVANPTATYTNPDGTVTTTAKAPTDLLNLASYNGTQVNPVLDLCAYAGTWQNRTSTIKIVKTGQYWLTFAGLGTPDGKGGVIDDVRLTALGSLAMPSPPSAAVAIPAPDPQPGATIAYPSFSIRAEQTP